MNYLWRLIATGICFSVFGFGSLILGVGVIPFLKNREKIRWLISFNFRAFFWLMHCMGVLRYRVRGAELIAADRGCLVVANHPSLIDVVALIGLYPNACCIIKRQLWDNFFVKKVVRGAGYIPNDNPEILLESCKESLDRGDVLIIFPEGTRVQPGEKSVLQRGAAHIALRLKRPLRTIKIDVEPSTLTKNVPWYKIPSRRVDFTVTVKRLLPITEYIDAAVPMSLASRRLTREIGVNIDIV